MKKEIFAAYAVIGIGYWFYLIWALGATSAGKAYLFGRAIMWPFILLGKLLMLGFSKELDLIKSKNNDGF